MVPVRNNGVKSKTRFTQSVLRLLREKSDCVTPGLGVFHEKNRTPMTLFNRLGV
jgi:hypothetical protein